MKDILKFEFDLKNGFCNYSGTEALSHYHEAAYDAYEAACEHDDYLVDVVPIYD